MHAVILCGGLGTRFREITEGPKCLANINGNTILYHQLTELDKCKYIDSIVLCTGYKNEEIIKYLDRIKLPTKIPIIIDVDQDPKGDASGIIHAMKSIEFSEYILVINGDLWIDYDINKLIEVHQSNKKDLTVLNHYMLPNNADISYIPTYHDAGIKIIKTACIPMDAKNINKSVIPNLESSRLDVYTDDLIIDLGTPNRFNSMTEILSKNYNRKCLFVDRDNTLIKCDPGKYITSTKELELLPGVKDALHLWKSKGYLIIVITNQPVIARGDITESKLYLIHKELDFMLDNVIDAVYYCPHHPDSGFEGEVPELKIKCECRKPNNKLIEKAIIDYKINRHLSWMIGDSDIDMLAGLKSSILSTKSFPILN